MVSRLEIIEMLTERLKIDFFSVSEDEPEKLAETDVKKTIEDESKEAKDLLDKTINELSGVALLEDESLEDLSLDLDEPKGTNDQGTEMCLLCKTKKMSKKHFQTHTRKCFICLLQLKKMEFIYI